MSDEKIDQPKGKDKKAVRLEIKIDDEIAAGTYANLCIINHSDAEFVLDFVFMQPARRKSKVASRIIMSPKNAKRMLMLLQQQVKAYEKRFGELSIAAPMAIDTSKLEIN